MPLGCIHKHCAADAAQFSNYCAAHQPRAPAPLVCVDRLTVLEHIRLRFCAFIARIKQKRNGAH